LLELVKKQAQRLTDDNAQELLKKKRDAISEGDVEKAEEYENKYNEIKQEAETFKELELKQQAKSSVPPDVQEFIDRNSSWFNRDTPANAAMVQYAEIKEQELIKRYPQWSTKMHLEEVEKAVKSFFHDKFENTERYKPSLVEAKHVQQPKDPNNVTYKDLPPEAKEVVDNLMKMLTPFDKSKKTRMSRDDYARQLLMTGAIQYE
jgi:hypothetical protein